MQNTKSAHRINIQNKFFKIMIKLPQVENISIKGPSKMGFLFYPVHLKMETEPVSTEKVNAVVML
jgi:hypothetical protein